MKKLINLFIPAVLTTIAVAAFAPGCGEPVDPGKEKPADTVVVDPDYAAKKYMRDEYMNVYYYWYKEVKGVNSRINLKNYGIYDLFDMMLYSKDRWSWMCDKEYYIGSETGVVSGTYGASIAQPYEYHGDLDIRVRFVYPGSPFAEKGVTRGWTLTHINGIPTMSLIQDGSFNKAYSTSPQTFTFNDTEGNPHTFTATASQSLNTHSSLMTKIFTSEDFPGLTEPVGYFHYLSFKAYFLGDISEAMETFRAAGVKTVILDLRYNGGGDSRASQLLVDYLAPADKIKSTYVKRVHNDILASQLDEFEVVRPTDGNGNLIGVAVPKDENGNPIGADVDTIKASSLGVEHLYVITGEGTASASEMITNGLRPMMDVKMVGDTTYGKPNGMYVLMYPGSNDDYKRYNAGDYTRLKWVFLPICFYNMNGVGQSIPDNGFIPDNYRPDDLYNDFGPQEDNIKACLTHIVTGQFPEIPAKHGYLTRSSAGKKIDLTEEAINPAYGLYTVMPKF